MNAINHSAQMRVCRIRNGNPENSALENELFATLESLFPMRFVSSGRDGFKEAGEIRVLRSHDDVAESGASTIPSLVVVREPSSKGEGQRGIEVMFADDLDVPMPFRGRKVSTKVAAPPDFIHLRRNERVLAISPDGPIWTVTESGGAKHFRSALPLPRMSAERNFNDLFNGENFLEMLPVLQFLRELLATAAYRPPPLRAAYIIDDPNLHWLRYGCVDYREIAKHAERENYHVSFATVPLDAWFTHAATAEVFRHNSRRLSLLVHGNNHAKRELAARYTSTARERLLQQAIRRIEHLESRGKVRVCRVMVPPHGACSDDMLAAMPMQGFESACVSADSLRAHNREKPWTKTLGFYPSEVIKGCPVLPRWGLSGNVENTLLVAAYLGRPLILRGHHQDLKEGVDILDGYARFINGLGDVLWSRLSDLSRMNYLWRMDGSVLQVKPLGMKIHIELPATSAEVAVEAFDANGDCLWQVAAGDGSVRCVGPGERIHLSPEAGRGISIERIGLLPPPPVQENFERTSIRLVCRRLLAETRDRLWA